MIYVYAITHAPAPAVEALQGASGAAVSTLASRDLAAVFSPLAEEPEATPDALWAHERVVEQVMAAQPVLPVQFGMTLAGEGALTDLLDERRTVFEELLATVDGCVELSVRVRWIPPQTVAAGSGRQYLEDRLQERRRADQVHRPLAGLSRSSTSRSEPGLLAAAYLVPSEGVGPFTGRLEEIRDEHPTLDFSCTGPWPPYSFVGES
ncbi:MAG: GvpL/GvpF family gas vesicle protein [Solirubrobacteraceae bacterium]